jgi:hypothetical protein
MAIPYTQTTMANVRAVEGTYISYPFLEDGDTSTKVYNMICTQRESDYSASQIDLDDPMTNATTAGVIELPFTGDSSAYFVGDTGHSSIGGGMIQFTRTFANIPKSITIPSGSAFVSFPGLEQGHMAITSMYMDMTYVNDIFLTTTQPHGFSTGDTAYIKNLIYNADNGTGDVNVSYSEREWQNVAVIDVVSAYTIRVTKNNTAWTESNTLTPLSGQLWNKESNDFTISSLAMNPSGQGIQITPSVAHNLNVGQTINISMQFTVGSDPYVHVVTGRHDVTSVNGTVSFVVEVGIYFDQSATLTVKPLGKIRTIGDQRLPASYNVPTFTSYSYILPGVSTGVSDVFDVIAPQTFQVVSPSTGGVVDTATDGYYFFDAEGNIFAEQATLPSASGYKSIVGAQGQLVIEATLSDWSGNILVLKTKTCRAR